ncbi:MAG: response regulator transcription factor [Clostridia bacterium]|nr:response regulator transcription factor [Clostridia bacterium]
MHKIHVAICDDIKQMRDYFSELIATQEDMEVVGTSDSGAGMVELAKRLKPDVILMDIQMESEFAGIDATASILKDFPSANIIIITVHDDDEFIFDAFVAGAVDYLVKNVSDDELFEAIRNAHKRNVQLNNDISHKIVNEFIKMKKEQKSFMYLVNMMCNLSPYEMETLQLLCKGVKRKEIAEMRCVELVTIHTMVARIMKKLGYKNSNEMINEINELGVLPLIKNMKEK